MYRRKVSTQISLFKLAADPVTGIVRLEDEQPPAGAGTRAPSQNGCPRHIAQPVLGAKVLQGCIRHAPGEVAQ